MTKIKLTTYFKGHIHFIDPSTIENMSGWERAPRPCTFIYFKNGKFERYEGSILEIERLIKEAEYAAKVHKVLYED